MTERTILIVEDVALERKLYTHILEACGYRVITAENGTEGLRRAREANPDLVLLDIRMPGQSGLEVAPAVNADAHKDRIPMIAVTGALDDYPENLILESGFDAVVPKPVRFRDLISSVERSLFRAPDSVVSAA